MSTSQKESAIDENVHFARIADRRQFPRSTHASAMIKKLTLHGSIATTSIAFATVRDGELHYEGFSTSRRVLGFKADVQRSFLGDNPSGAEKSKEVLRMPQVHP
jgi:hypothetical protein